MFSWLSSMAILVQQVVFLLLTLMGSSPSSSLVKQWHPLHLTSDYWIPLLCGLWSPILLNHLNGNSIHSIRDNISITSLSDFSSNFSWHFIFNPHLVSFFMFIFYLVWYGNYPFLTIHFFISLLLCFLISISFLFPFFLVLIPIYIKFTYIRQTNLNRIEIHCKNI